MVVLHSSRSHNLLAPWLGHAHHSLSSAPAASAKRSNLALERHYDVDAQPEEANHEAQPERRHDDGRLVSRLGVDDNLRRFVRARTRQQVNRRHWRGRRRGRGRWRSNRCAWTKDHPELCLTASSATEGSHAPHEAAAAPRVQGMYQFAKHCSRSTRPCRRRRRGQTLRMGGAGAPKEAGVTHS